MPAEPRDETQKQCVARAAEALALRDCLQQSRQSRTALRQYYAYINPIRQQLGLKPLQWVRYSAMTKLAQHWTSVEAQLGFRTVLSRKRSGPERWVELAACWIPQRLRFGSGVEGSRPLVAGFSLSLSLIVMNLSCAASQCFGACCLMQC